MTSSKLTAVLNWFKLTPATDREVIDMASSKQVALWTRLRHHYWLTDCKPLTAQTLVIVRRKMHMIDGGEPMAEAEVAELLTPHFGFQALDGAWVIPELLEHRQSALDAVHAASERARRGGQASGRARAQKPTQQPDGEPIDF